MQALYKSGMNCFYEQHMAAPRTKPVYTAPDSVQPLNWKLGMENVKMAALTSIACASFLYSCKMGTEFPKRPRNHT